METGELRLGQGMASAQKRGIWCVVCSVQFRRQAKDPRHRNFGHMPTRVPGWQQKLSVLSFRQRRAHIPALQLLEHKEQQNVCHGCYRDALVWEKAMLAGEIPIYPSAEHDGTRDLAAKYGVELVITPSKTPLAYHTLLLNRCPIPPRTPKQNFLQNRMANISKDSQTKALSARLCGKLCRWFE